MMQEDRDLTHSGDGLAQLAGTVRIAAYREKAMRGRSMAESCPRSQVSTGHFHHDGIWCGRRDVAVSTTAWLGNRSMDSQKADSQTRSKCLSAVRSTDTPFVQQTIAGEPNPAAATAAERSTITCSAA